MSHRPEDAYEYVAVTDIMSGMTRAFAPGDPVPADTVEALGLLDSGDAVHRDDYTPPDPEQRPARAAKRGEMPPHLAGSVASDAPAAKTGTRTKTSAAAKAAE